MDDDACLRLDARIRAQAARLGAPDLGDRAILSEDRTDTGERRPLPPRERLLRRLASLERHVLLLHRGVYDDAMAKIRNSLSIAGTAELRAGYLETAIAVLPGPGAEGTIEFDLALLPDLSGPLARIRGLRALILEDDDARSG